jgi:dihydrofolate reductase
MIGVLAMTPSRGIGLNGKLPWPRLQGDFDFFKAQTLSRKIIIGRNTFETLPILVQRECIVLTSSSMVGLPLLKRLQAWNKKAIMLPSYIPPSLVSEGDELIRAVGKEWGSTFLCGGAKVYRFLPCCDKIYLTYLKQDYEADTFVYEWRNQFEMISNIQESELYTISEWKNSSGRNEEPQKELLLQLFNNQ